MKKPIVVVVAVLLLALLVVLFGPVPGQADGGADPIIGGSVTIDTLATPGQDTAQLNR
jgi:hypothetical protein